MYSTASTETDSAEALASEGIAMKRTIKPLVTVFAVFALALVLAACGGSQQTSESAESTTDEATSTDTTSTTTDATTTGSGDSYKIGVIQLVEHDALDAANKGFVDALDASGISYEIDQQNAQGDQTACQTIASKLVGDQDNLILAIATPAAQAVAGATTEIPIVGTAITDFADSGLVDSNDAPGGNVTGSSDLTPVADQIKMLHTVLPDAKTVGILFCTAEANSELQATMAEDACKEQGIKSERYTASSSNEIQSVVESMIGKVDAIYVPTDNTMAASAALICSTAEENNIPVIAGEQGIYDAGALCTYTIDYYELGKLAGDMAVRILRDGEDPATTAIEYYPSDKLELLYNKELSEKYGIDSSAWESLGATA